MRDVVRVGTARELQPHLGRSDIAGKPVPPTTTKDAWFVGFNPSGVTAVISVSTNRAAWAVQANGGTILLVPVWVEYMRFAPERHQRQTDESP